jgi:hypothetical protein
LAVALLLYSGGRHAPGKIACGDEDAGSPSSAAKNRASFQSAAYPVPGCGYFSSCLHVWPPRFRLLSLIDQGGDLYG